MVKDSLWLDESNSPKLGKMLKNTFSTWKRPRNQIKPQISSKVISTPFGVRHISHVDTTSAYGLDVAFNIEDHNLVRKYLPSIQDLDSCEPQSMIPEQESQISSERSNGESQSQFHERSDSYQSSLDPGGSFRAFSCNKTSPTIPLSGSEGSGLSSPLKSHRRAASSISSISRRNSYNINSRMSYQSVSSFDFGSPLEYRKPSFKCIPQYSELNELEEEEDDIHKFQVAPNFPPPPPPPVEVELYTNLEDIPCDSDSDSDSEDFKLQKCELTIAELTNQLNLSSKNNDLRALKRISRQSIMLLRNNDENRDELLNLIQESHLNLKSMNEEIDFFGDLNLDGSILDELKALDIVDLS